MRAKNEASELDEFLPRESLLQLLNRCSGLPSRVRYTRRKVIGFSRSRPSLVGAVARGLLPATPSVQMSPSP